MQPAMAPLPRFAPLARWVLALAGGAPGGDVLGLVSGLHPRTPRGGPLLGWLRLWVPSLRVFQALLFPSGPRRRFATERGARCPASRRPRVAPIRDAGVAARPLQPSDSSLLGGSLFGGNRVLENGACRAQSPWKHRAPARRKRQAGATDLYVEQDPEVEWLRQAALPMSATRGTRTRLER
jgi:hypothetical protein